MKFGSDKYGRIYRKRYNEKMGLDPSINGEERAKLFKELLDAAGGIKDFTDLEDEDAGAEGLAALLSMPDESFNVLAPLVLGELQKSLNNVQDKVFLAQALNAAGGNLDDLLAVYKEFYAMLDGEQFKTLGQSKIDFLKEMVSYLYNAIADTEGTAKKIIQVPVEKLYPQVRLPEYAHLSDSGLDVFAPNDITVYPGETVVVPTGIKVAVPLGYELQVRPKSGRALKTKLRIANTPGTIDAGYRDEVGIIVENIDAPIQNIIPLEDGSINAGCITYGQSYTIGEGEKFAQLVLCEVPKLSWLEVGSVKEIGEDRGGGYGSTGLK